MLFRNGIPLHCTPVSPFLARMSAYFGICLSTPLGFTSTVLGNLSILSWLFAQMPQIYKNYQMQSTAGLSIFFLAEWLCGDITNLVGAVLTKQAGWQVVVASYYVFVDVCLVLQYLWYTQLKPILYGDDSYSTSSSETGDADSDMINSLSPINTNFAEDDAERFKDRRQEPSQMAPSKPINTSHFSHVNYEKGRTVQSDSVRTGDGSQPFWLAYPSPRTLVHVATITTLISQTTASPLPEAAIVYQMHHLSSDTQSTSMLVGKIFAWCSTFLYLVSRLPQIYKNWRRQSTAGLSPLLFFAAFCGNLFYSTSMLTNPSAWYDLEPYGGHGWAGPEGSDRLAWITNAAPFFLGAFGVLGLDAMVGVQFLLYGEQEEKVVKVRDREGVSRWQRVNGWMRGFIPTMRKEKVVDLSESQRLIASNRDASTHSRHNDYGGI